ncbi:MAG: DUF1311 domain-containing protein [Deltaproteobacteria bacterium]|nr:DUF1311 domain-containing protein [Deltaproteobacteria bacterium]
MMHLDEACWTGRDIVEIIGDARPRAKQIQVAHNAELVMPKSFFLVRAVVAENLRDKFDHWTSAGYAVFKFASMIRFAAACLLAIMLFGIAQGAAAAQERCPFRNSDACGQWEFEQVDKQLADVVASALAQIEHFAHPNTRAEAKDRFAEAQRTWASLRDLDCQAESAFQWLRSALTRAGYTAGCKYRLTVARIAELKRRYLLKH